MPYKLTPEADKDLIEIYLYGFQNFGEAQAEKYFSDLEDCFQLLSEAPFICRERAEFTTPVRIHPHGRHLVVYAIRDDEVLIARVLHASRDVQQRLFPL